MKQSKFLLCGIMDYKIKHLKVFSAFDWKLDLIIQLQFFLVFQVIFFALAEKYLLKPIYFICSRSISYYLSRMISQNDIFNSIHESDD